MKKNKFTEVCILDICTSDYFCGYQFPVIAVPVYKNMTNIEISDAIQDEINSIYDYLTSVFSDEDIQLFEKYCIELQSNPDVVNFEYLPDDFENDSFDSAYMYISLCSPVYRYGIKFLNE